jgi:hypothetical protein
MSQHEIEIQQLKNQVCELQEQLKKYTAPTRSKRFYQNHKEELKQKTREYKEKTNYDANIPKDKKKEYNKKAYEKRKEKMKTVDIQNENPTTETI